MCAFLRKTQDECYAVLNSTSADQPSLAEYVSFRDSAMRILSQFGDCVVGSRDNADFLFPSEKEDYDLDRVLMVVTMGGRRLSRPAIQALSEFVQSHKPAYVIFVDGEVSHGKSFEIVLHASGEVWGSERKATDLLGALGFAEK